MVQYGDITSVSVSPRPLLPRFVLLLSRPKPRYDTACAMIAGSSVVLVVFVEQFGSGSALCVTNDRTRATIEENDEDDVAFIAGS